MRMYHYVAPEDQLQTVDGISRAILDINSRIDMAKLAKKTLLGDLKLEDSDKTYQLVTDEIVTLSGISTPTGEERKRLAQLKTLMNLDKGIASLVIQVNEFRDRLKLLRSRLATVDKIINGGNKNDKGK